MAGQTANSGLITQAIGRCFSYRLLVIPALALLMVMAMYVAIRSNRAYAGAAGDNEINLGQESLGTGTQQSNDFALGTWDTDTPSSDGSQQPAFSYTVQENDEGIDISGTQEGYSNVSAMTASYADWGAEDNRLLSALLGHLKKTLPEARVPSAANNMVAGAAEA